MIFRTNKITNYTKIGNKYLEDKNISLKAKALLTLMLSLSDGCKFYKNGKTKTGVQKYICLGCKNTVSETTNTIIYYSKLSFEVWSNLIDNLLNGFSIRRIAEENNISILTSFRIRHKILMVLTTFIDNIKLSGEM